MDGTTQTLEDVTYDGDLTATITAMNPRYGNVEGGETLTFTGTNFIADPTKYTIIIDGIECPVSSATETSLTCTTGDRPGLVESSLEIYVEGMGLVSNRGLLFRYVSFWSAESTWGGEFAPLDGESVYVPTGLNLLVDIDRTPLLNLVYVEGGLIFPSDPDPEHERFFEAHYVFINKGFMEVGTEEFPYTSKLTITMHS